MKRNFIGLIATFIFISTNLYSRDVVIDNKTDCYIIVNLDDNCDATGNGPYDAPAITISTYSLSTDNINDANDVDGIGIVKESSGAEDVIYICSPTSDTSPHLLDNNVITCRANDVYVEWTVNGSDFEIIIRY